MADVKWIKIHTGIFDDEKIKLIDSMPDRDAVFVIWIKLLTLAGRVNDNGMIYVSEEMPYTDEMYAAIFNRPVNTVKMALDIFRKFNMIDILEGKTHISNWEKHQNIDGLEKIREANRKRVAKYRENTKLITCNVTGNVTVTECNAIEEDKNKNKIKNKIKNINNTPAEVVDDLTELDKAMIDFEKMRKQIKKPMTDRAKTGILNKLVKLADTEAERIEILNQSIVNCWADVYPLKEEKKQDKNTNKYESNGNKAIASFLEKYREE